ncbi:MAG TPA: AAA family ATPase [Trebonia sp.]|jgi:AAA+ ATPase superfamily predicted ATPase|nr:AAA family ATPase [Trebonia sp.]
MVAIARPADIFNRTHEWEDLARFAADGAPGLRIGIVRGRRRHGKSFLLEHVCRAVHGAYLLALQESRTMALDHFSDALGRWLGFRVGRLASWAEALDTAVESLSRIGVPLLVLDEFPYLAAHSPELPSVIQALYDRRGPASGAPGFKIILCGSAISVMSTLLAGNQALRGRAVIDMRMGPFSYRDAAAYWGADAETAFLVDAVLGGAPGYKDIVGAPPAPDRFFEWLERSVLNPSHALFTEPDYLLAEDPRIGDRAVYHAIWEAVAGGATTPTRIASLMGMDTSTLTYHLNVMRDGGFLRHDQDLLLQRRPVITVADPVVRFHNLVVKPNLLDFEMRNTRPAWERSLATFTAKIEGPHFEELAREWTRRHAHEAGLDSIGQVGTTVVACREHGGHEVDVVALDRSSLPRRKNADIALLGEAKHTSQPRGIADLRRLEHVAALLSERGWNTASTAFALFSRSGFTRELTEAVGGKRVRLLSLGDLYRAG